MIFYPIKDLSLEHSLVKRVLGAADWEFRDESFFRNGGYFVTDYPLLKPNNTIEIEVLDSQVFVIRNSTGQVSMRGILSLVCNARWGHKEMYQSAEGVVFWPNEQKPIGEGTQQDKGVTGFVSLEWIYKI